MVQLLNRSQIKADAKELLRTAQVSPKKMTALYFALTLALSVLLHFVSSTGPVSTFLSIFSQLLSLVLDAGFILYCMGIRRHEYMEYTSLFDGFSFVGKLIAVNLIRIAYSFLWGMLFVIPGIMAYYRYRFAVYHLCEDPDISVFEALQRSARQTKGYKMQLFNLDMSYLGWFLLSTLPAIAIESYLFASVMDFGAYMSIPASLGEILLQNIWALIVALFYYPNYVCADLAYFEASGAAQQTERPDDLGGF